MVLPKVVQLAVPVIVNFSPPTGQVIVSSMGMPAQAAFPEIRSRKQMHSLIRIAEALRAEQQDLAIRKDDCGIFSNGRKWRFVGNE